MLHVKKVVAMIENVLKNVTPQPAIVLKNVLYSFQHVLIQGDVIPSQAVIVVSVGLREYALRSSYLEIMAYVWTGALYVEP